MRCSLAAALLLASWGCAGLKPTASAPPAASTQPVSTPSPAREAAPPRPQHRRSRAARLQIRAHVVRAGRGAVRVARHHRLRLAEQIAHGREADAIAFSIGRACKKLTVVRVLTDGEASVRAESQDGLKRFRGCWRLPPSVVSQRKSWALADTAESSRPRAQLKAVGAIAAAHPTRSSISRTSRCTRPGSRLHDPAFVKVLPISCARACAGRTRV